MGKHEDLPIEASHFAHAFSYADEAARVADTGRVAGDVGKLAIQLSDWSIWILTSTTPTWEPACKKAVFGTDLVYDILDTEVTTTSSTPSAVLSISVDSSENGDYRIGFSTSWKGSATNKDVRIHLFIDGSEIYMWNMEPKDASSYHPTSQHYIENLSAGPHTVSLRVSSESGATSRLKFTSLEFWRVS